MIKTLHKLFIWLLVSPKKGIADYIKVENSKRILFFNKKKVYFSDIMVIDSRAEKNYSRLVTTSNEVYYYYESIINLTKMTSENFIRISGNTAINYKHCTELLNNSYCFLGGKDYKIGESFKTKVEAFFEEMQNKNI